MWAGRGVALIRDELGNLFSDDSVCEYFKSLGLTSFHLRVGGF